MKSNGTTLAQKKDHGRGHLDGDGVAVLIREDVNNIKSDVTDLVRHGRDGLTEIADRAAQGAKAVAGEARDRATRARDSVNTFATERPMATIAIAAAGGALLWMIAGKMMRRR